MVSLSAVFGGNIDDEVARIVALPYRRELIPDDDGVWFAKIGEFRGCITQGDSQAEALDNIEDAMREWVRAELEDGHPIPPPTSETEYGGKVALRLPRSLHRDAAQRAERDGVSLNTFVVSALSRAVGAFTVSTRGSVGVSEPGMVRARVVGAMSREGQPVVPGVDRDDVVVVVDDARYLQFLDEKPGAVGWPITIGKRVTSEKSET